MLVETHELMKLMNKGMDGEWIIGSNIGTGCISQLWEGHLVFFVCLRSIPQKKVAWTDIFFWRTHFLVIGNWTTEKN